MVRPAVWRPAAELSSAEQAVVKAVRRARLFVFLRLHRHELFDEQFQAELAGTYVDSPKGQPPVPPARLALAVILQAYTGVSDDEVIEAAVMDRRWQLVLDCLGAEEPPFSKGTLVGFRKRLIEKDLDRRLVERTVELAAATGEFGARALRAALERLGSWVEDQQWFAIKDHPALREPVVLASNRQSIEYIVAQCRAELRGNPSTQVKSVVLPEGSAPPGAGTEE